MPANEYDNWFRALAVGLLGLSFASCDDTAEIHLVMGDCHISVIKALRSVDVRLKRNDGATWQPPGCTATGALSSIAALGDFLGERVSFREVPLGGSWTVAVKGYADAGCNDARACGRVVGFDLSGGAELTVRINCPPSFSDAEAYKACLRE